MKFVEMRKVIEDNKEFGYRFMIADEMQCFLVDGAGEEVKDEVFEMLCERVEEAYLKATGDIEFEMYQICEVVYDMYMGDILYCSSAYDIVSRIGR